MEKSIFQNNLLSGKKILVTGSNSGIGKYTSDMLLEHGAKVIKTSRNFEINSKKKLLNNSEFICIEKDLSDENAAYDIFNDIPIEWLPIDGIFIAPAKSLYHRWPF